MRKNSIRKLIHGILDLLPLFVIPIFAININQKSVEPISIEVQEQISVDLNQEVKELNNINWTNNYTDNRVTFGNNSCTLEYVGNQQQYGRSVRTTELHNIIQNHYYVVRFEVFNDMGIEIPNFTYRTANSAFYERFTLNSGMNYYSRKFMVTTNETSYLYFGIYTAQSSSIYTMYNFQVFDLTQMNLEDITIEEFNSMFPNSYYEYTESQKMLVDKPTPTTYDDTDIGSQFLYSLYISTDNYFNMNNVFNLNSVYSWFEMNIFGGSAPLSIYIVWNIIIYELVMDLLMLLYALFMFFIDACQKLIDKPLESIK